MAVLGSGVSMPLTRVNGVVEKVGVWEAVDKA